MGRKSFSVNFETGDPNAGAQKVAVCAACHGTDGNSQVGNWPKIAGQNERYLFEQLKLIKTEERYIDVMKGLLDSYSEEDLRDVAAFYANNSVTIGQSADDESLVLGKLLIRLVIMKEAYLHVRHVMQQMVLVLLSGLSSSWRPAQRILSQLFLAYKNGERISGPNAYIMNQISNALVRKILRPYLTTLQDYIND